jgi:hypothetical protein
VQLIAVNVVFVDPETFGVLSNDQAVPFHRADAGRVPVVPTAKQVAVPAQATPDHFAAELPGGVGLVRMDHALPFQRSIRVVCVLPVFVDPTAKQLVVAGHATAWSALVLAPEGFGLAVIDQDVPFQRSISVLVVDPVVENPTATQFVDEVHLTDRSRLDVAPATFGVDCNAQLEPFQRTATVRVPALAAVLVRASPTATHDVVVHDTECNCGDASVAVPFATDTHTLPL